MPPKPMRSVTRYCPRVRPIRSGSTALPVLPLVDVPVHAAARVDESRAGEAIGGGLGVQLPIKIDEGAIVREDLAHLDHSALSFVRIQRRLPDVDQAVVGGGARPRPAVAAAPAVVGV